VGLFTAAAIANKRSRRLRIGEKLDLTVTAQRRRDRRLVKCWLELLRKLEAGNRSS
jgi:hypothetical protein